MRGRIELATDQGAAQVVVVVRIAAVDDGVTGAEQGRQIVQHAIDHGGRHHEPDGARQGEGSGETLQRGAARCAQVHQPLDGVGTLVVHHQGVPAVQQTGAHAGPHASQTNHSELHAIVLFFRVDWVFSTRSRLSSAREGGQSNVAAPERVNVLVQRRC